jgi:hypothetical protein
MPGHRDMTRDFPAGRKSAPNTPASALRGPGRQRVRAPNLGHWHLAANQPAQKPHTFARIPSQRFRPPTEKSSRRYVTRSLTPHFPHIFGPAIAR